MQQETLEILNLTPNAEKLERLDEAISELMTKYLDLVWLARTNPNDELLSGEHYEILAAVKRIEDKYPEDTKALYECETNWQHGFNSGMLACCRYFASYIEDDWWPLEETGGVDFPPEEIQIINGKEYVQFDGRDHAKSLFPELDT